MLNKKWLPVCLVLVAASHVQAQTAGTLVGQVGVQLVIGAGCSVINGTADGGNQWGTLNFGQHASLTSVIDAQVIGGAGNIQIQCTTNTAPTMTVGPGLNFADGQRNMRNSAGAGSTIAYSIYSDPARTLPITAGTAVAVAGADTGTAVNIPIYGRVLPAAQSNTAPEAGTYSDTLQVTLAW